MGTGLAFECRDCGYHATVHLGIGFMFPDVYQETVWMIRKEKFGQEWKDLFEKTPGAAVNADMELYVCLSCGAANRGLNLSLYEPKDASVARVQDGSFSAAFPAIGMEYVMPDLLEEDYRLVEEYVHLCPDCGKPMRLYREGDLLKCPKCGKGRMELDPRGHVCWD